MTRFIIRHELSDAKEREARGTPVAVVIASGERVRVSDCDHLPRPGRNCIEC